MQGPFYILRTVNRAWEIWWLNGLGLEHLILSTWQKVVEIMDCELEIVTVERKLWAWLKDMVDDRDMEGVRQVLEVLERVNVF